MNCATEATSWHSRHSTVANVGSVVRSAIVCCVPALLHLLWVVYTNFINEQSDTCPLPNLAAPEAKTAANAVLEAVSALVTTLDEGQRVVAPPAQLRGMVAEGLALLREIAVEAASVQ